MGPFQVSQKMILLEIECCDSDTIGPKLPVNISNYHCASFFFYLGKQNLFSLRLYANDALFKMFPFFLSLKKQIAREKSCISRLGESVCHINWSMPEKNHPNNGILHQKIF